MNPWHESLPLHWKQWVEEYVGAKSGGKFKTLGCSDFNGLVKLDFLDGSHVVFQYAFYAVNEEKRELAVFTEHCGYHVFPLTDDLQYSHFVWAESPGDPEIPDEDEGDD